MSNAFKQSWEVSTDIEMKRGHGSQEKSVSQWLSFLSVSTQAPHF